MCMHTNTHRNNYNIMWKVVAKDKVQCQFKEAEWYNNLEQCFSKYHSTKTSEAYAKMCINALLPSSRKSCY